MPYFEYKTLLRNQPVVNRHIRHGNERMLKKICEAESQYPTRKFLQRWREVHELVEHHTRLPILIFHGTRHEG